MRTNIKYDHIISTTIPKHISVMGLYTSTMFIITGVVCYYCNEVILSIILFILYVTSIFHWSNPLLTGFVRNIDMTVAGISLLYGTYVSTTLPIFYTYVWFITLITCVSMFVYNEYLYQHQILAYNESIDNKYLFKPNNIIDYIYYYTSLEPSMPNTTYREYCYQRSAYTHLFFLHFILCLSVIYCLVYGKNIKIY